MKPVCRSAARTKTAIIAQGCPLEATCGYRREDGKCKGEWGFCDYFAGSTDVEQNLLMVQCKLQDC